MSDEVVDLPIRLYTDPDREEEIKAINSEIKKWLLEIELKDDKNLRTEIAYCYFKRGCIRLDVRNFVGSMYDLTLSLQYNVTPLAFFKRGELFAKLEFYEQALADFQSSYDYSTNQKDKDLLLPRILKLKESVEEKSIN